MVIDTSAIIAVLRAEAGHEAVLTAIASADSCIMAAPTRLELAIVLRRSLAKAAERRTSTWLDQIGVEIAPFDGTHTAIAIEAYREFGRGSGHPARLNFGDCSSYALAVARDEPLLFVGDDFVHTDVRNALAL